MGKKHKLLVGLASLTLWDIAAAGASDLPVNARPTAYVPSYNWSGFYVGAHAGYRWADASFSGPGYSFDPGSGTVTFPSRSENYRANGGIVGAHIGYNYMLTPVFLAGLEGDWTWGSASQSLANSFSGIDLSGDGFTFSGTSELRLTWQSTIRGRLGIVTGPWLVYGTGGVAFAHAHWSDSSVLNTIGGTSFASWSADKTLTGVAAGFGVEYMYTSNWLARIEYLYENFGNFNVPFGFGPQVGTLDLRDVSKVRIGVSYKFGP